MAFFLASKDTWQAVIGFFFCALTRVKIWWSRGKQVVGRVGDILTDLLGAWAISCRRVGVVDRGGLTRGQQELTSWDREAPSWATHGVMGW